MPNDSTMDSPPRPESASGAELPLARIARIAEALEAVDVHDDAQTLAERATAGRFFVACIGQFKRGKSTLLDALVGDPVLPAGVVPVTTVPTVLRYGPARAARVRHSDGVWRPIDPADLSEFVSEESNPENVRGVLGVEVLLPCALLASGMCLVDTPGLGSVFSGNTEATRSFVPHIDAAIVVIGTDPPISGDELSLVDAVSLQVTDLLFVLNKADRHSDLERRAAVEFAREVLSHRLRRSIDTIYEVSARERLDGEGPERDWGKFRGALETLATQSGAALATAAERRGTVRLAQRLLVQVAQERDALVRPITESENGIRMLAALLSEAGRWLSDLAPLLRNEERSVMSMLAAQGSAFLYETRPAAARALRARLASDGGRWGPALRRRAMRAAQEIARDLVEPWLVRQGHAADAAFRAVSERFVHVARDFLERVASPEAPEWSRLAESTIEDRGLDPQSHFYFNTDLHVAEPASPLRFVADVILGAVGARPPIRRDAERFLGWLLEMNSSRVLSDVGQRVAESRRLLERQIEESLRSVHRGAERALARAASLRSEGAARMAGELERLAAFEEELREIAVQTAR